MTVARRDGLRVGDQLLVSHTADGKTRTVGRLTLTLAYATDAEAHVSEETGVIGPEDVAHIVEAAPGKAK